MITNVDNFLHSLIKWMAAQAAAQTPTLSLPYEQASGNALFRNAGSDDFAAAPYSVLQIYGGPAGNDALPRLSVQVETIGTETAALTRAYQVFELLLAADHRPLRMQTITGYQAADNSADGTWRIVAVDLLGRPGKAGKFDDTRVRVVFNFDIGFVKAS